MNVDIIDQERLLIGAMLIRPDLPSEFNLQSDDFGHLDSKLYYEAILATLSAHINVNIFSVAETIRAETNACHKEILMLMAKDSAQHTQISIKGYAERIKKESMIRKARFIIDELTINLRHGKTDSIGETISKLMNVDQVDKNYSHSFAEVNQMVLSEIEALESGEIGALSTGFKSLDMAMGGFFPSDLIIIPARPAMGKTAVLINMFINGDGIPGVISAEQGVTQMGMRAVCIAGRVNHHQVRTGKLDNDGWAGLTMGTGIFQDKNGQIFDKPAPTMLEIEKVCRQWVFKNNVNIIFIDYAQRISHENRKLSRYDAISDIAMRLKELARSLNVPVIALAQVNRACENRPDRRPQMGDIADASAFEKEADSIITLYRDEVYNEDSTEKGIMELDFKKNRHGPTGCIKMQWLAKYMRIEDFTAYESAQS